MPLPVRPHLAAPVVAALIAVIVAFVTALWVSPARTREIATRAHAIAAQGDSAHTIENAREISRAHQESRDLAFSLDGKKAQEDWKAGKLPLEFQIEYGNHLRIS